MSSGFPSFLTHYTRGAPFRSVTSAPAEEWPAIVARLDATNTWGLDRFADPTYLARRVPVEARGRTFHPRAGSVFRLEEVLAFAAREPGVHGKLEAQLWMVPTVVRIEEVAVRA